MKLGDVARGAHTAIARPYLRWKEMHLARQTRHSVAADDHGGCLALSTSTHYKQAVEDKVPGAWGGRQCRLCAMQPIIDPAIVGEFPTQMLECQTLYLEHRR
jgi:hypothetical protein